MYIYTLKQAQDFFLKNQRAQRAHLYAFKETFLENNIYINL